MEVGVASQETVVHIKSSGQLLLLCNNHVAHAWQHLALPSEFAAYKVLPHKKTLSAFWGRVPAT